MATPPKPPINQNNQGSETVFNAAVVEVNSTEDNLRNAVSQKYLGKVYITKIEKFEYWNQLVSILNLDKDGYKTENTFEYGYSLFYDYYLNPLFKSYLEIYKEFLLPAPSFEDFLSVLKNGTEIVFETNKDTFLKNEKNKFNSIKFDDLINIEKIKKELENIINKIEAEQILPPKPVPPKQPPNYNNLTYGYFEGTLLSIYNDFLTIIGGIDYDDGFLPATKQKSKDFKNWKDTYVDPFFSNTFSKSYDPSDETTFFAKIKNYGSYATNMPFSQKRKESEKLFEEVFLKANELYQNIPNKKGYSFIDALDSYDDQLKAIQNSKDNQGGSFYDSDGDLHVQDATNSILIKNLNLIKEKYDKLIESFKKYDEEYLKWQEEYDGWLTQVAIQKSEAVKQPTYIKNKIDDLNIKKLNYFYYSFKSEQIIPNFFLSAPDLSVDILQNKKSDTYKGNKPKVLFNFNTGQFIKYEQIEKPKKNLESTNSYIPSADQIFINNSQPDIINVYRADKDVKNLINDLFNQDSLYKILDANKENCFYEDLEPNKDYYYFYFSQITKSKTTPVNITTNVNPLQDIKNTYINGIYTFDISTEEKMKKYSSLEYELKKLFFIICSNIVRIRLVKDDNFYYVERETITPKDLINLEYGKKFKEKFFIKPKEKAFELGLVKFSNNNPYIKVRLTSKKTRKKIDLNLQYTIPNTVEKINKEDIEKNNLQSIDDLDENLKNKINSFIGIIYKTMTVDTSTVQIANKSSGDAAVSAATQNQPEAAKKQFAADVKQSPTSGIADSVAAGSKPSSANKPS
jgi:hypothetical protein